MSKNKEKILSIADAICPGYEVVEHRNQLTLVVSADKLCNFAKELRDNPETSYDQLLDVTAIDQYRPKNRFEIVYFLYSNKFKDRLRLKILLYGENPSCPTITTLWESANWYERETYDMYGINFEGHPNLRRFYMPEDFNDPETGEPLFPLRKDFPLMGIPGSLPLPLYPERDGDLK